jgi:tRNA threonylcarbamoyladenosine biosynthesis protein TsaB
MLTIYIQDLCARNSISFSAINCFGVLSGPGSYTGLRIALSTAKGLCYSLNKPLVGINTIEAMVDGFMIQEKDYLKSFKNPILFPMIDARRMEVYTCGYSENKKIIEPLNSQIIDENFFEKHKEYEIICFGSGALKCRSINFSGNINIIENFQTKSSQGFSSFYKKFQASIFEDPAYYEPSYVKEFYTTHKLK